MSIKEIWNKKVNFVGETYTVGEILLTLGGVALAILIIGFLETI